jgi:hypothetical protein
MHASQVDETLDRSPRELLPKTPKRIPILLAFLALLLSAAVTLTITAPEPDRAAPTLPIAVEAIIDDDGDTPNLPWIAGLNTEGRPASIRSNRFASVRSDELASLSDAVSAAVHAVREPCEAELSMETNRDVRYWASNPAESMLASFMDHGVRMQSSIPGSTWGFTVKRPGASPRLTAAGSRAEYRHEDGVIEWYENGSAGIQQGFTVASPLAGPRPKGEMCITLQVDGMSVAQDGDDGQSLCFSDADGRALVGYRGLKAWDANGRVLDSAMVPQEGGLSLVVKDDGAVYPIEIDPYYLNLEQSLMPVMTGTGINRDNLGQSVAISANTVVVGAPGAAPAGRIYVFVIDGSSWTLQAELWPPDGQNYDSFGQTVDIEGDTLVVGAFMANLPGAEDAGSVYVYHRSGGVWSQQAKLVGPNPAGSGWFGSTVSLSGEELAVGSYQNAAYLFRRTGGLWSPADTLGMPAGSNAYGYGRAVALQGDTLLLGAPMESVNLVPNAGAVYVMNRSGGTWQQTKRLVAPTALSGDAFGSVLALDGDVAVVGVPSADDRPGGWYDYGAAYIFRGNGSDWVQEALFKGTMLATDGSGERMGAAVAVSGNLVVVGTPGNLADYLGVGGMANVYHWNGTTWAVKAKLNYTPPTVGDKFGAGVAVDGGSIVVGAPWVQGGGGFGDFGSVFTYAVIPAAGPWLPTLALTAGDGRAGILLGSAVALEGDTAVVGAPNENGLVGAFEGAAYVFVRSNGRWQEQARLTQPNPSALLYFGRRVAVDGDTVVVGSNDANTTIGISKGCAEVFVRNGTTWSHQQTLNATNQANFEGFATGLAMLGDSILVGAPYADNEGPGLSNGNVYWFSRSGNVWTQRQIIKPANKLDNQRFGSSVDIDGSTAVIGAEGATTNNYAMAGQAFAFEINGTTWSQQALLTAPAPSASAFFGNAVAISGDTVLVGASGVDGPDATGFPWSNGGLGQAYVFTRSGTSWSRDATLNPEGTSQTTNFGFCVALDGNNAIIGTGGQSAAYLFTRFGTTWTRQRKYEFESLTNPGGFGKSAAVDGDTVLIGVPGANRTEASINRVYPSQGMVQAYRISNAPTVTVTNADGAVLADGMGSVGFGGTTNLRPVSKSITITNTADVPLDGLALDVTGSHATMFEVWGWSTTPLAVAASRMIEVTFAPTETGICTAMLQISGSDSQDGTYDVALVGTGLTPRGAYDQWASGLAEASPDAMPYSDGVPNLVKYAFNMNGGAADRRTLVAGSGVAGLPVGGVDRAGAVPVYRFEYLRRKGSGLVYAPECSTSLLAGSFTPPAGTMAVVSINADWERVIHEVPMASAPGTWFIRVRISLP